MCTCVNCHHRPWLCILHQSHIHKKQDPPKTQPPSVCAPVVSLSRVRVCVLCMVPCAQKQNPQFPGPALTPYPTHTTHRNCNYPKKLNLGLEAPWLYNPRKLKKTGHISCSCVISIEMHLASDSDFRPCRQEPNLAVYAHAHTPHAKFKVRLKCICFSLQCDGRCGHKIVAS